MPHELHKGLKSECALRGISLSQWFRERAENYLAILPETKTAHLGIPGETATSKKISNKKLQEDIDEIKSGVKCSIKLCERPIVGERDGVYYCQKHL